MPFMTSNPALARALAERDYTNPTPVQLAVLAPESAGRDLLVSAQTGSGKTVAYGLAAAETLLGTDEQFGPATIPLALVVAPTRELALQVQREFVWLYAATGARIVSCVGGMDPRQEQRLLAQGAHIVVGTPGRLRDHIERGRLDVSALRVAVLDEADEMLDLGFREDLEFILDATPPERRSLLFSATLPRGITALAKRYQNEALRIEVASAEGGHADIEYRAIRVAPKELEHAVVNVLRFYDTPTAIVFCNTREAVRHLHATLQERQFSAVALSGELSQNERNHALQALRDGRARVCVATDVAARGIDLPNLGLVIHADLPNDAESLQHRSGRTGRAGRKGVSVLMVPPFRRRRAEDLLAGLGIAPEWSGPPTAEDVRKLDHDRMLRDPLLLEEPGEEDAAAASALLASRDAAHLVAALVRLYRAGLPAPEEVSDPGEPRARERRPRGFDDAAGPGGSAWFRLNVGRRSNADPKWLLPLICRRGNVTRQDIGAIRIFDTETAFEVGLAAAERFAKAARKPDGTDVVIEELPGGPPAGRTEPPARARAPYRARGEEARERPSRGRPARDVASGEAAEGERPARPRPAHGKPAYDPIASDRAAYGKPPREKAAEDRPAYDKPSYAKPAYDKPSYAKAGYDKPARGKPAYEKPAREKPGFDKPGFDKPGFDTPRPGKRPARSNDAAPGRERPGGFAGKPKSGPAGGKGRKPPRP
ncbi:DEAD/DEAH box helicase [Ancylobacter lacus]|uniref:DEAD/DEAH box helicase n=1 Tax=Ancylobacter lacus TaxID=2579970 RepID=UPI001BCD05CD|nr:DEAD/DEAH box helicase [Ancylobacter lacus]MBS7538142.1 DEAD/DEAH box helicase [Ancylobacter lacus]